MDPKPFGLITTELQTIFKWRRHKMTYKYFWKFNEINQCFRNILSSRLYSFSGSFKNDLGLCFQNHTCPWKDTLYSILSEFMQHRHTQGLVLFGTDGNTERWSEVWVGTMFNFRFQRDDTCYWNHCLPLQQTPWEGLVLTVKNTTVNVWKYAIIRQFIN